MSVGEGLFDNESVCGVIGEWIAQCGCFGRALGGVVVADGLHDAAELAVGICQTAVGFLHVQLRQLFAQ